MFSGSEIRKSGNYAAVFSCVMFSGSEIKV